MHLDVKMLLKQRDPVSPYFALIHFSNLDVIKNLSFNGYCLNSSMKPPDFYSELVLPNFNIILYIAHLFYTPSALP